MSSSPKADVIELEGIVVEILPGTKFHVKIDHPNYKDHVVLAHLSGKMRTNYITILPGDKVKVEVSIYDPKKGRLTYRYK